MGKLVMTNNDIYGDENTDFSNYNPTSLDVLKDNLEQTNNILDQAKKDLHLKQTKNLSTPKNNLQVTPYSDLSIVTIYCSEDEVFMNDYLNSIPAGCEVILAKTVKKEIYDIKELNLEPPKLIVETILGSSLVKFYEIYYYTLKDIYKYDYINNLFSFANLRNQAISLATKDIIFSLDMDEQILITPSDMEFAKTKSGAFATALIDYHIKDKTNIYEWSLYTMVRMWYKNCNLLFENRCHETITRNAVVNNIQINTIHIPIRHNGYINPNNLLHKAKRNIGLMTADIAMKNVNNMNYYILHKLYESIGTFISSFMPNEWAEYNQTRQVIHFNNQVKILNNKYKCNVNIDISYLINNLKMVCKEVALNGLYLDADDKEINIDIVMSLFSYLDVYNELINFQESGKSQGTIS
jgi:hypothetical protein